MRHCWVDLDKTIPTSASIVRTYTQGTSVPSITTRTNRAGSKDDTVTRFPETCCASELQYIRTYATVVLHLPV